MNQIQLDGITKARLADNIALAASGTALHPDDAAYITHVCASAGLDTLPDSAADSYAAQYAGRAIEALELELVAAVQAQLDAGQLGGNGQPAIPPVSAGMVWESIKRHRDRLKASGVKAGGHWFHSDADSRIQQLALFVMGGSVPAVPWKTLDGSFVTMTQTLAAQIFQGTALSDMAIFSAAERHLVGVNAAADAATYDWSSGWPAAFAAAA